MTKRSTTQRALPTCACCIAAMLANPSLAVAATTRAMSEQQAFLGLYEPETNVDDIAALDLDHRSIVARLATGDGEGLLEAQDVYSKGRDGDGSGLTIKLLSTMAGNLAASSTYQNFLKYYGESDYADQWIEASFEGGATSSLANGDVDFSNFDFEGRAAAIRWGIPLLHVWMNVVGLLEMSAATCQTSSDNASQVAEWDKAVALYTGSVARQDGTGGYFLFTLAQVECYKFGLCKKGDPAPVNAKIFNKFVAGKSDLLDGNCSSAKDAAGKIKGLMTVPLVQGVIRAMYAMDIHDDFQETTQGMGAAFAAALLPLVNACSEGNAYIMHNDMTPGKALKGSYEVVRAALERSYDCLGVICEDVGGLVDLRGNGYMLGAEACNNAKPVERPVTGDGLFDNNNQSGNNMADTTKPVSYGDDNKNDNPAAPTQPAPQWYNENNGGGATSTSLAVVFGILCFICGAVIACLCKKEISRKTTRNDIETDSDSTAEGCEELEEKKASDQEIV
ncbi:hypothetical protein ACHAXR_012997 [Thalassiosira sp. AJA248-18]